MFLCLLYISVTLAAYILVMIVVQRQASFSRAAYAASAAGLLVLLFLPLAVVVRQEYRIKKELEDSLSHAPAVMVTVLEKSTVAIGRASEHYYRYATGFLLPGLLLAAHVQPAGAR